MPRLNPVNPQTAEGKTKELLDGVHKSLGVIPNLLRALANSPAALGSYLAQSQALAGASLNGKTRESIALVTSEINGCDYCASAHTAIGKNLGLSDDEAAANLNGQSEDGQTRAILAFASAVVEKSGWVSDEDLGAVRAAGLDDGAITEIVATVAATTFTNYFNHVAGTEIDFPLVETNYKAAA